MSILYVLCTLSGSLGFPVKISLERKSISTTFNTFDIEIRFDLHSKKLTLMKYIKTAFDPISFKIQTDNVLCITTCM